MVLVINFEDRHGEFENELQEVTINLKTKEISGNENGMNVWSKVVDTGVYTLITKDDRLTIYDYVPDCIPNEYGDYIDLDVKDGKVTNWTSTDEEILAEFQAKTNG